MDLDILDIDESRLPLLYEVYAKRPLSWVLPDLAVGDLSQSLDVDRLKANGIVSIISLCSLGYRKLYGIDRWDVFDSGRGENGEITAEYLKDSHIEEIVLRITQALECGKTFIHCYSGQSTAPAWAAAYIAKSKSITWKQAKLIVKNGRPQTLIHEALDSRLGKWVHQLRR